MPIRLHHQLQGPEGAPVVVLAPSLGTTLSLWDDLASVLARSYRVVRFDLPGHGSSPAPAGSYSMEQLAGDVIALLDSVHVNRFAFVGLSLGGAVGQVLALGHPDRVAALVLCCTGPSFGEPSTWRERAARVREAGMPWLVEPAKARWFTPELRRSDPRVVERLTGMLASTDPVGYAACCDALAAYDVSARLGEITAPTRVIAGAHDPVSPPSTARAMVAAIPGADLVVLEDASHMASAAQPERFNDAVREHLEKRARHSTSTGAQE